MAGRGRHRRPQPPTRLTQVSLAVTASGATAALPLLTGTGPEAPVPGGGLGATRCGSADRARGARQRPVPLPDRAVQGGHWCPRHDEPSTDVRLDLFPPSAKRKPDRKRNDAVI